MFHNVAGHPAILTVSLTVSRPSPSGDTVMLTDAKVKAAKPAQSPYKLADGEGMYLLVNPSGRKYWRLDYRHHDKRHTLALGVYPTVSLAEAREKRRQAKELIRNGINPGQQRKLDKLAGRIASENTFKAIADEYLDTAVTGLVDFGFELHGTIG
jgi:hypothetical protein